MILDCIFYNEFLLPARTAHLYLRLCVLPHTPTEGAAKIFSLIPMLQPGIKLTSAHVDLFLRNFNSGHFTR